MKTATSPYIQLRQSGIHNTGVFAARDIPKGTEIIEYVGEKITKKESAKRYEGTFSNHKRNSQIDGAVYIFELNKRYDIDGNVPYNPARYINHSCSPNCEAINIDGQIWICAIKDIKKGEELSYDYGYGLDDFEDHPCLCGSENCVCYIVAQEYWPELKRIIKEREK